VKYVDDLELLAKAEKVLWGLIDNWNYKILWNRNEWGKNVGIEILKAPSPIKLWYITNKRKMRNISIIFVAW
jgi:hypothetical protein